MKINFLFQMTFSTAILFSGVNSLAAISKKMSDVATKNLIQDIFSAPGPLRLVKAKEAGIDIYPTLIGTAFSENENMSNRWKALVLASQIREKKSLSDLEKAIQHKQWFMKNAALTAMAEIDSEKASKHARALLKDKALVVRSKAVEILSQSKDDLNRDLLWEELNQPRNFRQKQSLWIRSQIAEALAKNAKPSEYPLFVKLLKEEDIRLVRPSVAALEKISGQKLGSKTDTLAQRKNLWMAWAKQQTF